nr:LINE-type retrotransposon LIb DNA [Ipomoea batatas]
MDDTHSSTTDPLDRLYRTRSSSHSSTLSPVGFIQFPISRFNFSSFCDEYYGFGFGYTWVEHDPLEILESVKVCVTMVVDKLRPPPMATTSTAYSKPLGSGNIFGKFPVKCWSRLWRIEAVPPPIIDGGPVGSTTNGARNVKRYKHLKRSFVEVAADSPAFEKEDSMQTESENWFKEDIAVDSDKEDDLNEREDGIPVGSPQEDNMVENMHVEEPQPPPPIAKHGTWMIVNRKTKGFDKKPEKARDKSKGKATSNSVKPHKDLNVAQADNRTGGASGVGRFPGRTVHPVHNVAKATSKEKQVDNVPVSNAFSYLQDLEGLPEAPVLLEEETVTKVAPKAKNQRRNNMGKKQATTALETSLIRADHSSKGGAVPNQLFVFGNHSIATMNANSGNSAASSLDGAALPARIKGIQEYAYFPSSRGLQVLENKLIAELNQVLVEEEMLWFQKSRRLWIQDGDRNMAFYHKSTLIRRNRARIRMLKVNGEWNSDFKVILDHISNFFIDLFNRRSPDPDDMNVTYEGPKISHAQKAILPRDEANKIRSVPIALDNLASDALYWSSSLGGMFSVHDAYRYIAGSDSREEVDWVWKVKTSKRCRMFLWLAVKNKLLTNEVRVRRQLTDDSSCMACGELCESVDHILMHCDVARACWRITHTPTSFMLGAASPFLQWLKHNCPSTNTMSGIPWTLTFSYTCWELWKARNRSIFDRVCPLS